MKAHYPVWPMPIALGLISLLGLLSALIGDGWWDWLSWFCLGWLVAICVYYGWLRRR